MENTVVHIIVGIAALYLARWALKQRSSANKKGAGACGSCPACPADKTDESAAGSISERKV